MGIKHVLAKFDRLKADYYDRQIVQTTLDYYHFLCGSITTFKTPPTASNFQNNESPDLSPNCSIIHRGTVERRDGDVDVAFVNTVRVPSGNESPNKDIVDKVYKFTYPFTLKFIYPHAYIGNGNSKKIGKRGINMTIQNPRQLRGLAILSSGKDAIKRIDDKHYQVKSQHGDFYYEVEKKYGIGKTCSCPNWKEYQQDCKHIYAVDFSIQLRLEVKKDIDMDNVLEVSETVKCPNCESQNVIKRGKRKTKKGFAQRFGCKDCSYRFVVDKQLSRLKATPEVVSISMDLYFKGNSLAKIQHHLKMFHKTEVDRSTILRWIHKFSKILNEYSEKHRPQVGDLWNSDEMTVNIREDGKKKNFEWIWNLMDSETRYLLSSKITKIRSVKEARKPLKEAKTRAGKSPKALITDGQHSYREAVKKEYGARNGQTIHFRTSARREHFLNQNIERLNSTMRERLKVMRGLDSEPTAQEILDGERFYYNNIRPHMSLDGMTPGQIAGLPSVPVVDNPWLTYIKKALKEKATA
jgi:transposase-like protein